MYSELSLASLSRREEEPAKVLGTKLRQIFAERGVDFFEKTEDGLENMPPLKADLSQEKDGHLKAVDESDGQGPVTMSTEELFKMRMEIAPQLLYVKLLPRPSRPHRFTASQWVK